MKRTIKDKSEKLIKANMTEYSKLKNLNTDDENLKIKDYIRKMTLRNARTKFRIRSQMLDVKMNKKSDRSNADNLWRCDFCRSLDSQSHIMWCPAFVSLREGKNLHDDDDLISYVQQVMKIRSQWTEMKDMVLSGPQSARCHSLVAPVPE